MKKTLLAIAVIFISTSALAAEGHGCKILREEIHAAPGSNYHVKHISPETFKKTFHSAK